MPKLRVEIDSDSGFCFGVVNAITKAEKELENNKEPLYSLGDIVHNGDEVKRLSESGLKVIEHSTMSGVAGKRLLLRAHGEPPSTYQEANALGIKIIDATCPVVLKLQQKIRRAYLENVDAQIVIYGKNGHAEVNGLVGQTDGNAIVVEDVNDEDGIGKIDFSRDILFFSQTTKPIDGFKQLSALLEAKMTNGAVFTAYDTICRQVAGRQKNIENFAKRHDVIIFVGGDKSSNAKALFQACYAVNRNSHFIQNESQIDMGWFEGASSVGICGATSTPMWQMERISEKLIKNS
ncbi:MAG: 4-hydroxy-3-methylbut-2-enyl diphosphate reductase [Paludibacteraceae bacterium]|nr:4-hydroxy-3-methylbut-2-enyl diphosphate reductase [Paludibacteraceae bacterium]